MSHYHTIMWKIIHHITFVNQIFTENRKKMGVTQLRFTVSI